ncbi:MAG: AAA family ATPase [Burkholderiaceae bacterium]|nr:AAA family ATPase [Burkholderiaceae bacterium]
MSPEALALIAANPFPGLRAFKPGESDRFFGRGQQIAELVQRLREVPLVAVSGASGCGKSSLVLAGLLAELRRRHDALDDTDWRPVVMRPGARPIAHLAASLAAVLYRDAPPDEGLDPDATLERRTGALVGALRLGGLGLVEAVRAARLPGDARVLVVVDQFEEIFRFKRMADADEAAAFVKLLLAAADDPASPVSVVLTLRSDALGACAEFRDLPEAVSRGGYLVPRLKREQRKEAIVRPIELRGARIAPRLVQRLLNDVSDDFDDLPVMQHALSRTWQHWAEVGAGSRPIDLEDYEAIGAAADALSNHADEACRSLGALGDPGGVVERVFRALTERVADMAGKGGGQSGEVRRPMPFSQLVAVAGLRELVPASAQAAAEASARASVTQVVERFRRADTALLLPGPEVALDSDPVIDISHESLIRLWRALRAWVQAEAEAATELERLLEDVRRRATENGELRRGRDLARALLWRRVNQPNAAWVGLVGGQGGAGGSGGAAGAALWAGIQQFLADSEQAEARAQRRAALQLWGFRGLAAAVVLVSFLAAFNAARQQRQTLSRELAARSMLALDVDPAHSARLAAQALDEDDSNRRAQYALRQAMAGLEVAQTEQIVQAGAPLAEARYGPGRRRLLLAGGPTVWLHDPATLARTHTLKAPAAVLRAWLVGQGAGERVVALGDDWKLHLLALDAAQPPQALACGGEGNSVSALAAWSAEAAAGAAPPATAQATAQASSAFVAIGCYDGELSLVTLGADGRPVARQTLVPGGGDEATSTALGFSSDGRWLAAGDNAGLGRVWRLDGSGQAPSQALARGWIGAPGGSTPIRHQAAIRDIGFHPSEPSLLASASDDRSARVWRLDLAQGRLAPDLPGQKPYETLAHDRPVASARFVQRVDDDFRLMTVSDKRVFFWTDAQTRDERRHDDWVTEAGVSDDGELLVSASADGTARIWSSRTRTPIAVLRGHRNEVTHAFFGRGGQAGAAAQVLTASRDGTLRRWRITPPLLLDAAPRWAQSAAFSPDGRQVLVCGERDEAGRNCRIAPLADLGQRPEAQADSGPKAERLEAVPADNVQFAGWSHDGQWVLGQNISHDIYASARPVLWRSATRARATPDWLLGWNGAAFHPGRAELVTMRDDGEIALWPLAALEQAQPKPLQTWAGPPTRVPPLLSADGRWLAAIGGSSIWLWDRQADAKAPPLRLQGHGGDVRQIAFSRDSSLLASASNDRSARVWRLAAARGEDGQPPSLLLQGGHSAALWSLAFAPDGRHLVTSSADNSIRVWAWDVASGEAWMVSALHRHGDAVNAVAWHGDGQRILSASDDGTVQLAPCQACIQPLAALRQGAAQVVSGER